MARKTFENPIWGVDMRGLREIGGTRWEKLSDAELDKHWRGSPEDVDGALAYLTSQPGLTCDVIGLGGAGLLGLTIPSKPHAAILPNGRTPLGWLMRASFELSRCPKLSHICRGLLE
jgi:hypothetical protein